MFVSVRGGGFKGVLCVDTDKTLCASSSMICVYPPRLPPLKHTHANTHTCAHSADLNRDRAGVNGDQKSSAGNRAKLSAKINAVLINYTKDR